MEKRCIGCKREIGRGQQECYVCGAPQSYVRYYIKSWVVSVLLFVSLVGVGYWYLDKIIRQAELENVQQVAAKEAEAAKRIQDLELRLVQSYQKIQLVEANIVQNSDTATQDKLKFDEAEKRAFKAEERAGWLGRENRRFKAKVQELTDKLAAARQAVVVSNQTADAAGAQLTSLKQALARFENQKQTLTATISTKKKQLETSWQQMSANDAVAASAEELAQRAQQIEQATADENNQVLLLNGQIEAVKKKISDIEGS